MEKIFAKQIMAQNALGPNRLSKGYDQIFWQVKLKVQSQILDQRQLLVIFVQAKHT